MWWHATLAATIFLQQRPSQPTKFDALALRQNNTLAIFMRSACQLLHYILRSALCYLRHSKLLCRLVCSNE